MALINLERFFVINNGIKWKYIYTLIPFNFELLLD